MRESSFGKSKAKALNKFTHFTGPHVSGTGYVTNIYDHNLLKLKSGKLADWYRLLSKQQAAAAVATAALCYRLKTSLNKRPLPCFTYSLPQRARKQGSVLAKV